MGALEYSAALRKELLPKATKPTAALAANPMTMMIPITLDTRPLKLKLKIAKIALKIAKVLKHENFLLNTLQQLDSPPSAPLQMAQDQ